MVQDIRWRRTLAPLLSVNNPLIDKGLFFLCTDFSEEMLVARIVGIGMDGMRVDVEHRIAQQSGICSGDADFFCAFL